MRRLLVHRPLRSEFLMTTSIVDPAIENLILDVVTIDSAYDLDGMERLMSFPGPGNISRTIR